jgi:hypothetical protein
MASAMASEKCDALHGLSKCEAQYVSSVGRARFNLTEECGDGGHRYTRLDPLAEVVTKRIAKSVSAMEAGGL